MVSLCCRRMAQRGGGAAAAAGVAALAAAALLSSVVAATSAAAAAAAAAPPPPLTSLGTCAWQADYFRAAAVARVDGCGLSQPCWLRRTRPRPRRRIVNGSPAAAAATAGASNAQGAGATGASNVQVAGVDEADTVKGDGRVQYVLSGGVLTVVAVRGGGGRPVVTGRVRVPRARIMLADGPRLLVVSRTIWNPRGRMQQTALYRVDASRAGAPVITSTLTVDGAVTAARSVGGTATLTISNNLAAVADMALNDAQRRATPTGRLSLSGGFASPAATSTAAEANRRVLRATADGVWVPTYTLRRGGAGGNGTVVATGPLVPCARTYRPAAFAGFSLQSVVRVPVGEGAAAAAGAPTPAAAVAVASGGGAVYATATSLYVTTTAYGAARAASTTTAVHRFDTAGTSAAYVASGAVAGRLLNQFSLHERSGVLFVATTERANGTSSSTLTALKVRAPCYGCRPRLTPIGRLGGLGPDERIYAVRYVGTTAYIVTFRETDPLYAISLADPTRLVSLGALKIPGFSRYLHPLSPTLLLGLGQHANARGETEGAKASLFRVPVAAGGDGGGGGPPATALAELDTWKVPTNARGGSGFEAANDHLAFSWWPARQLVLAPWWRSTPQFSVEGGLTLLHVDPVAGTLTPWGTITHPAVESGRRSAAFIERVVVVRGRYLWSVSDGRVEVHDLDNRLARTGGVAFG